MKFIQLTFFISLILFVCSFVIFQDNLGKIRGDLTFEKISFLSFYDAPDSLYQTYFDNVKKALMSNEPLPDHELELYHYFGQLYELGLIKNPYILLRVDQDSTITIYLSEHQYDKVKNFKHKDLIENNKRVILSLDVQVLDKSIYYSDSIYTIESVMGQTYPDNKVLKY